IDWSRVDKNAYLQAMERSPINDTEIKQLLAAALTERINDREIFMKGLDASYFYENYFAYRSEDLIRRRRDD
ncbi:MAG: cell filamentation protein Fic, partial [Selenomonadaceae bacterium]|nr:cell filamentation protein Fic [Selenomonadaceae bacterium]